MLLYLVHTSYLKVMYLCIQEAERLYIVAELHFPLLLTPAAGDRLSTDIYHILLQYFFLLGYPEMIEINSWSQCQLN